ncbi:MAG: glucosaminidase domain-containing protein [Clostridium sp.]|nr:glucosaminidase domain-containing protein [Clostridium sp.]MCM1444754.1 glucosaminidase domain-containing protein [Candidatus Amulumruptor caecigallinarius]
MKENRLIFITLLLSMVFICVIGAKNSTKLLLIENRHVLCENKAEEPKEEIVYDGMTFNELSEKLNKSLNSTVAGKGDIFAKYSLELGVDPYLAVAVMLHETGCKWNCSYLARVCNNYGGQKGGPSCNGGSYKKYETQEEGIKGYISNLYYNYISKGLTTPEQINKRYAADPNWHLKIEKYISQIKSK